RACSAARRALPLFPARRSSDLMSGTDDIAVGTPIAGRGEAELDDLIGMFVNTLVLRTRVAPELSFDQLLAANRDTDLRAFANARSEEHTSELQSRENLVCRLLL